VLITGSVQGLGLAAAESFAQAGCHVVLSGLADRARVRKIRSHLEDRHHVRTLYSGADLRKPSEIERMVSVALETFGSIDVLVNNAVVRHAAAIEEFSPEHWDEAVAVNLSAAFHTTRLVLPSMRKRNWGRIINVSSIYGLRGTPCRVGYVTTKTALIGMTRAVALESVGQNITCNAVCPGTTESPVHDGTIRALMSAERTTRSEAEQRFLARKQPTGRMIAAAHVARLMVFLCAQEAADITGAVLPIDGGWSSS
jgi:3-hydroxybutyrate dehydrogenase